MRPHDPNAPEPQPGPGPSPTLGATAEPPPAPAEGADEALHFGLAWHRYRYCYRGGEAIRALDAGCGTGRSSVWAAQLNPGARVTGLDISPTAVELARGWAAARGQPGLDFLAHDITEPLPHSLGEFDFVVCRRVLAEVEDADRALAHLGRALAPDGLLFLTLPSRRGREAARAVRQAVEALAPPGAGLAERSRLGVTLVRGLRLDHPIRCRVAERWGNDLEAFLADALAETREWDFEEAARAIERAGLRPLYATTPRGWRPDRSFAEPALGAWFERLAPDRLARVLDALEPAGFGADYELYACRTSHTPVTPAWPEAPADDHDAFDRLIPHRTGLARPVPTPASASPGRVLYQTVSGALGELDRLSNLMLQSADGTSTIGAINGRLAPTTRASDKERARKEFWVNLADSGLLLLGPPEAQSHRDARPEPATASVETGPSASHPLLP